MNHTTDTAQPITGRPRASLSEVQPRVHALAVTNPRQLRALLAGPVSREQLGRATGASNSPAVINRLTCTARVAAGFDVASLQTAGGAS